MAENISKFTADIRGAVIASLRTGKTLKEACKLAGVGLSTVREWLRLGEELVAEDKEPKGRSFSRGILRKSEHLIDFYKAVSKLHRKPSDLLNEETIREIVELCGGGSDGRGGISLSAAGKAVGLSHSTVRKWYEIGEEIQDAIESGREPQRGRKYTHEQQELLVWLFMAVSKSRARREQRILEKLEVHGEKYWQALAWILERTDPERYGFRKYANETTVPKAVKRPYEKLETKDLEKLLDDTTPIPRSRKVVPIADAKESGGTA